MSRILITGAARGIGAASARQLAARGHQLALLGLEGELLTSVAADCGAAAYEVDVTAHDALDAAIGSAVEQLGGLDVVVANAGIITTGLVAEMAPDAWEQIIAVNLVGTYRTVRAALPHLIASRGYALPVASVAALAHAPLLSAYCASKAGVEAFADSLRAEVAHHGVDVGCAYFSWIDTDMVRHADRDAAFERMRAGLNHPFSKTYPESVAVDAIVRGIEARAKRVCGPRWIRPVQLVRGMIEPAIRREGGKTLA